MRLERIATKPVSVVNPGDTLNMAIQRMWRRGFEHLPVVDDGKIVGMVAERDLLIHAHGDSYAAHELTHTDLKHVSGTSRVDCVMTSPALTLSQDDPVEAAARAMLNHEIHAVPLAKHGALFGIVTETDLLKCFLDEKSLVISQPVANASVAEHMAAHVFSVQLSAMKPTVVRLMRDKKIGHVPVVDDNQVLIGIVSERDMLLGCKIDRSAASLSYLESRSSHQSEVAELMSNDPVSVSPSCTLRSAAKTMVSNKIGCVPVVKDEELVGIVTSTDLVRILLQAFV